MAKPITYTPAPLQIAVSLIIVLLIYSIRGYALWKSASYKQAPWFIGILLITYILGPYDLALVEIVYLFFFAKKKLTLEGIVAGSRELFESDALLFWKRKKKSSK